MRNYLFLSLLGLGVSLSSHAETRYVSMNYPPMFHSGPGNQYRIVWLIKFRGNSYDALICRYRFVQIKDDKDRTVWFEKIN